MSIASVAGTNDPSPQPSPGPQEAAGTSALGYGDIDAQVPAADRTRAAVDQIGLGSPTERLAHDDDDQMPQPLDPALIAGGEDLVGAANHVSTGADTMGADLSDDQDDPQRPDHGGSADVDERTDGHSR